MASSNRPKWCPKPEVFSVCNGHTSSVNALALKIGQGSSGRDIIFSGSGDESIRVWDMVRGSCEGEMHGHGGYISSLVLQNDYLVSASYDSTLGLWSATRKTMLKQIKAHEHCVNALMTHDSGVLLSASWDGTVRVWDLRVNGSAQTRSYASVLTVPDAALCLASTDQHVYCGLHDASVVQLDLRTGKQLQVFGGHSSYVTALTLHKSELFSASSDGSVRVTDVTDGRSRAIIDTGASCFALYHHTEGPKRWILSGHADGVVKLTDVIKGVSPLAYTAPEQGQIFTMVASIPGLLLTGAADGSIRCWGDPPAKAAALPPPPPAKLAPDATPAVPEREANRGAAAAVLQRSWRAHRARAQNRALALEQRLPAPPPRPSPSSIRHQLPPAKYASQPRDPVGPSRGGSARRSPKIPTPPPSKDAPAPRAEQKRVGGGFAPKVESGTGKSVLLKTGGSFSGEGPRSGSGTVRVEPSAKSDGVEARRRPSPSLLEGRAEAQPAPPKGAPRKNSLRVGAGSEKVLKLTAKGESTKSAKKLK